MIFDERVFEMIIARCPVCLATLNSPLLDRLNYSLDESAISSNSVTNLTRLAIGFALGQTDGQAEDKKQGRTRDCHANILRRNQ